MKQAATPTAPIAERYLYPTRAPAATRQAQRRINRPRCEDRLRFLWELEALMGFQRPELERDLDVATLTDDDLVILGKRVAARVQIAGHWDDAIEAAVLGYLEQGIYWKARLLASYHFDPVGLHIFIDDYAELSGQLEQQTLFDA